MSANPTPIQSLNSTEVPERVIKIIDLPYKRRETLKNYDEPSGTKRQNDGKNSEEKKPKLSKKNQIIIMKALTKVQNISVDSVQVNFYVKKKTGFLKNDTK